MPQTEATPLEVEKLISAALGVKAQDFWVKEITDLFPWAHKHRFFWGTTLDRHNCVVALSQNGDLRVLTLPNGWKLLSPILISESGSLPAGLTATEIAEAVRMLTVGPPGVLATPVLPQRTSPPLTAWIKKDGSVGESEFRSFCVGPRLDWNKVSGDWEVNFNYFNDRGGVEHWRVRGTSSGLSEVAMTNSLPDDSFNWPFE